MQPAQQQFMQPGQIPQQMQQFLQQPQIIQQQLQMQQAKPPLQQPPPMQMQTFNQNMQQPNPNLTLPPGIQQIGFQSSMQNRNPTQTPIDILGLADKAAQALRGRQQVNTMSSNPNFPPPPASAPGRPMASEKDLPMMVQYAVQVRICITIVIHCFTLTNQYLQLT